MSVTYKEYIHYLVKYTYNIPSLFLEALTPIMKQNLNHSCSDFLFAEIDFRIKKDVFI